MSKTVGDFVVERLATWGVRTIFGYPGDGINGVLGALSRSKAGIEFIQVRHEEMAAFMASAHAKFTGQLGVCLSTGGPARRTWSPGCTTPRWTTCRCWRSPARPRAAPAAPTTSRS
jgi:glyoxylate carboligase